VLTDASPYLRQILDFGGVPRHLALVADKHQAVWQLMHQDSEELQVQTSAS
jgi:hypothetical protein